MLNFYQYFLYGLVQHLYLEQDIKMIDWKDWLPKKSSIVIGVIIAVVYLFFVWKHYQMARNIFGIKKVVKLDKRSGSKYTDSDIHWEQFKIFIWILLGVLYIYYIVQPQLHF